MSDLFSIIVGMSISASWLILAVLLLRFGLKKAPKFLTVLLWGIVAIRLVCPVSFESGWSLIPNGSFYSSEATEETTAGVLSSETDATESTLVIGTQSPALEGTQPPFVGDVTQTPAVEGTQTPPVVGGTQTPAVEGTQTSPVVGGTQTPAVDSTQTPPVADSTQTPAVGGTQAPSLIESTQSPAVEDTQAPSIMDGTELPPVVDTGIGAPAVDVDRENTSDPKETVMLVLSIIWLAGVVALLGYILLSYLRVHKSVRTAVLMRGNIYQCETVSSPFVLGIIKPKIYIPFSMSETDITYVIAHEHAHIRRGDHLWKPLGFLLLALHWFNPFMWVAYALLCKDIELACDEKAVKQLNRDQRADYSQALLNCSIDFRKSAASPVAFGEVSVKERVKTVLNYKKPSVWVICISVLVILITAVCFLTDPITVNRMSFDELDEELQELVHESVKEHHKTDATEGRFAATACELIGTTERFGNTKLYAWVMYTEYTEQDGALTEELSAHTPTVLTVKQNGESYELVKYWTPSNSENWESDVRWEFPRAIRDEGVSLKSTEEKLKGECEVTVEKNFPGSVIVDKNDNINTEFWKGKNTAFSAIRYADTGTPRALRFSVVVYSKQVYINGTLYHQITPAENFALSVDEIDTNNEQNTEIQETLETLKNHNSCYVFETKASSSKIIYYNIDGAYYFVEYYDGQDQAEQIWKGSLSNQDALDIRPELYLQPVGGDWKYALNLETVNGNLYIYGYSYKKATDVEDLNLVYSDALLEGANGNAEILETLDAIKNQKPYCVLKAMNDLYDKIGDTIAVYEVNDVLYFLDCLENGEVAKIWRLSYNGSTESTASAPVFPSATEIAGERGNDFYYDRDITEELATLKAKYPMYFDLPMDNGLELYVWQEEEDSYSCVLLPARDPDYTPEEILALDLPVLSMEEVGVIATTYRTEGAASVKLTVVTVVMPHSTYIYTNDQNYQMKAYSAFLSDGYPVSGYSYYDRVVFDIDFDGVEEICCITGSSIGWHSTRILIVENGLKQDSYTITKQMDNMHFRVIDGKLVVEGEVNSDENELNEKRIWEVSILDDYLMF